MKIEFTIVCFFAFITFGFTQESNLSSFQNDLAKWEQLVSEKSTDIEILTRQRMKLLETWESIPPQQISSSMNWAVASANRYLISVMVDAGDFKGARTQLVEHEQLCRDFRIGLIGRSKDSFEIFAQEHAKVAAALGDDPLAGKALPYEFSRTDRGFYAVMEEKTFSGDRVNDIDGDVLETMPETETLGKFVDFDKTGRLVRSVLVGLEYPSKAEKLVNRIVSVYQTEAPGPATRGGFKRSSASELLSGSKSQVKSDGHSRPVHIGQRSSDPSAIFPNAYWKWLLGIGIAMLLAACAIFLKATIRRRRY
ncbi:MAG: hypothetical protein WCO57_09425 [Verrucomicrobiota bacterium]